MIPSSFGNEILKKASFLTSIAPLFKKYIPSALVGIQASAMKLGLGNVGTARMIGAGVGAAGGAMAGSNIGGEDNKGRNTLLGAIAGGAAGAFGGAALAPKVQTFGAAAAPALRNLGNQMASGKLTGVKDMAEYIVKKWSPVVKQTELSKSTTTKALGQTVQSLGEINYKAGKPLGAIAEAVHGGLDVANKGVLQGTKSFLGRNLKEMQTFERASGGKNQLFSRSSVGKIVNPALTSGVGMGALSALTAEGKDGEKPTMGKRLTSGVTSTLAWGAAPKLMMGKVMAYDLPKMIVDTKKAKAPGMGQLPDSPNLIQ